MKTNKWYIKQYNKRLEQRANDVLLIIGDFLVADVKMRTPVVSGNLEGSMTYVQKHLSVMVGTNVEYAMKVEFGTEKHPENARRMLQGALDDNKKQFQTYFNKMMMK